VPIQEEPQATNSPPPPSTPPCEWLTTRWFALLLALLLFTSYPGIFLGTHSFFDRDFSLFTHPVAHYMRESVWRRQIPLWNPFNNCGIPFLAQWNTTVCYPPAWFYVLFPLPWSLNLFCLAHLLLAGLGMYWLAFRWTQNRFAASFAGLAYALNGLSTNCLMWTSNLAALAWLPIVVLCVERTWREGRRRILLAAVCSTLQMLSGAPEIIMLTWVLLATLWLGQVGTRSIPLKRSALHTGLVAALTFLLCAPQLLPFLELLRHGARGGQGGGLWAMPLWGWANLGVPLFRCSPTILGSYIHAEQQWTSSYYVGISVMALALVAVFRVRNARVWWLAGIALGGLLLALGDRGIFYDLLRRIFPPLGLARYPIKFVILTVFALPMLAAYALKALTQISGETNSVSRRRLITSGLFWLAMLIATVTFARLVPYQDESWQVTATNALARALFLALFLAAIVIQWRTTKSSARAWLGVLILVTLGLDLMTHLPRQNPVVSSQAFGPMARTMSPLPRLGESRAMVHPRMDALLEHASTPKPFDFVLGVRRSLFCNCNLLEDIPKVNGFFSLGLREEAAVRALYSVTNPPVGLMDFLGVSQLSSPDVMFEWTNRETFLPFVTAGQQPVFANATDTLRALAAPDFDARRYAYLPLEARAAVTTTNGGKAEIVRSMFSAQSIDLTVSAERPAWVVVAQSFYPSWRAYVDDQPTQLWHANYAFQALQVPAGQHRVQLHFEDKQFRIGCFLCCIGIAICFGLWFASRSRHVSLQIIGVSKTQSVAN
jgi:hypothetical protein